MPFPLVPLVVIGGAAVLTIVGREVEKAVREAEDRAVREGARKAERRVKEHLQEHARLLGRYVRRTFRDVSVTAALYGLMWLLPYWVLPQAFFLCAFLYALYTSLARLPELLANLPTAGLFIRKSVSKRSISDGVYDIAYERVRDQVRRKIAYNIENLDLVSSIAHGIFGRSRSELENAVITESAWSIGVEAVKFRNSLIKYVSAITVFLGGLYFVRGVMWSSEYNWLADLWVWIRNI